jgi:hypothetical protein
MPKRNRRPSGPPILKIWEGTEVSASGSGSAAPPTPSDQRDDAE